MTDGDDASSAGMAKIYLVRHAKAGERRLWDGDDTDRPLSPKGHKQSRSLADRLVKAHVSTLSSSPYVRCVQTLEPLADRLGRTVEIDQRLAEEQPFLPMVELLQEVAPGAVLCSHGDMIPATIDALVRRGMELRTPPDWRKAAVWVLTRNKRGEIVHATVWPPPGV